MSENSAASVTESAVNVEENPATEEQTASDTHLIDEGDDVPLLKDEKDNEGNSDADSITKTVSIFDLRDQEHATNHRRALVVATTGLIFNLVMMVTAAMVGMAVKSSMLFVISSQHLLDAWGDCLVIWRFWCDPNDPNQERWDQQGCVLISCVAVTAGVYVTSFSTKNLIDQHAPHLEMYAIIVSSVIFLGALILGILKYLLARKSCLDSHTLHLDAITSFFCSLLAAIYLFSTTLHHYEPSTWALEHIAALCITFMLLVYALVNFFRARVDGHPPWNLGFWKSAESTNHAQEDTT